MTHLLETVEVIKKKSWQEDISAEIEQWPGGLILNHCFSWTNVLAGVILLCG